LQQAYSSILNGAGRKSFENTFALADWFLSLFPEVKTGVPMDWKKASIAAVAFAIISQVVYFIGATFDMGYYADPANASLWSRSMMPVAGPPPLEFFLMSLAMGFATGLLYALAFTLVHKGLNAKGVVQTGLKFGLFLFAMVSVTGFVSMSLLLAIPTGLQFSWLLQGLAISLASGLAYAKIMS
jgi:hypothetical protein